MKTLIVRTLIENTLVFDEDGKSFKVSNSKILNNTVLDKKSLFTLTRDEYQFTPSEVQRGYIHFSKKYSNFYGLYSANKIINVSINGKTAQGKWHSSQHGRIDRLTSITKNIPDLEARVFKLYYDAISDTIVFTEI